MVIWFLIAYSRDFGSGFEEFFYYTYMWILRKIKTVRTFEQVTIIPLLNLRCKTASQWWIKVLTISPLFTFHTRTVESLEPDIITLSSYCKHKTDPVCPMSTWNYINYLYKITTVHTLHHILNVLTIIRNRDFNLVHRYNK